MNYRRLISLLAERSGKTQRASREEIALFVSAIKEVLAAGKRVTIPRLGTFSTTAEEARSPKPTSTEPEKKPAVVRRVEFTPSSVLLKNLNEAAPGDEGKNYLKRASKTDYPSIKSHSDYLKPFHTCISKKDCKGPD